MPRLGVIELSQLPAFQVLETIDSDKIIIARLAALKRYWAANDPPFGAQFDVESLEFDPLVINQEACAYFEMLLRDRVNQAARSVTLAFAVGGDLDAIASRYPTGMPRLATEGAGIAIPTAAQDAAYRTRIWLSPNTLSPHGVYESYIFWALNAYAEFGDQPLRDAQATNIPGSPNITITIMADGPAIIASGTYDGVDAGKMISAYPVPAPPNSQILNTGTYIKNDSRQGLTDVIRVGPPKVVYVTYDIGIILFPGWDAGLIMPQIAFALAMLLEEQRWLGYSHTRAAIDRALKVGGVFNVVIKSPAADVIVDPTTTVIVNNIKLYYAGRGGLAALTST